VHVGVYSSSREDVTLVVAGSVAISVVVPAANCESVDDAVGSVTISMAIDVGSVIHVKPDGLPNLTSRVLRR
jgi:hypothetical protein